MPEWELRSSIFSLSIKPKKRVNAQQQRAELLRTNVNRVILEIYCQNKESFDPLRSFRDRLEEQFNLLSSPQNPSYDIGPLTYSSISTLKTLIFSFS